MMRIAITGATGLLGRNLLLELLKRHVGAPAGLEIIALGRHGAAEPLSRRLERIVRLEGADYLGLPAEESASLVQRWRQISHCVAFDLERDDLALAPQGLEVLHNERIDLFVHAAALTDLRPSQNVQSRVQRTNLEGTRRLLRLLSELKVDRLAYVGSAYAGGLWRPEAGGGPGFRNPYEHSKCLAENIIAQFAARRGQPCVRFQPAALCGRLLEQPLGSTCKFDTFYGWAAFFFRQRQRRSAAPTFDRRQRVEMPVRIHASPRVALNIVPVDYAGKTILDACQNEGSWPIVPIVSSGNTSIVQMIHWILGFLGIVGYEIVEQEPADKTDCEVRYYRSIGRTLAPYLAGLPPQFDRAPLNELERRTGGCCPMLDSDRFAALLEYAYASHFGLME